jgi:DNA primase
MADFAVIKERVSIEEAAQSLGLQLTKSGAQFRGPCPACGTGGPRALVITPAKGLFYCFSQGIGGDLISMWGHTQKCSLADAGRQIEAAFRIGNVTSAQVNRTPVTVPDAPPAPTQTGLKALDYLEPEHPSVLAVGFEPEVAEALGIGYAGKGILRGMVAIPLRLPDGTLTGYAGVTEAKLPTKWHGIETTIVPFPKRA